MARGKSDRRGAAKPASTPPTDDGALIDVLFVPEDGGSENYGEPLPLPSDESKLTDYKDALASVADRLLAKSSEPQTQPAPDPPEPDLQIPGKSDEAPAPSPSPKPSRQLRRSLLPGQWVTK